MAAAVDDLTLRLTRRFDASPERLFDAWTDQVQFAEWFGPQGVTIGSTATSIRGPTAPGACWGAIANAPSPSPAGISR